MTGPLPMYVPFLFEDRENVFVAAEKSTKLNVQQLRNWKQLCR